MIRVLNLLLHIIMGFEEIRVRGEVGNMLPPKDHNLISHLTFLGSEEQLVLSRGLTLPTAGSDWENHPLKQRATPECPV